MAQETHQLSPNANVGMTPEQQDKAVHLRDRVIVTQYDVNEVEKELSLDPIEHAIGHAMVQHSANKAVRAAEKHYRKHELAYQAQAIKEAEADGVKINQ